MFEEPLSVGELTRMLKVKIEDSFPSISIVGEVSNFKAHTPSGHWYFTLKDSEAQISCAMWKSANLKTAFIPDDGIKIICSGRLTVYPPRGNYQLEVRSLKPAGIGDLQAAFEKLKAKLLAEGLFDEAHKKQLPKFPKRIGVITGAGAAALEDIMSVAKRRYPICELIIAPTLVQGEGAADKIVEAIRRLESLKNIDVLILARGGGSIEDLWAFNEEKLARAIYKCNIPIITGIGHEVDFTIADFTADVRAATPTAAMELASPHIDDFFDFLDDFSYNLYLNIFNIIETSKNKVENALRSYGFRVPENIIKNKQQYLDGLITKLNYSIQNKLNHERNSSALILERIEAHNTDKILKKGFALIKQNGRFVVRSNNLEAHRPFEIKFYDKYITINR